MSGFENAKAPSEIRVLAWTIPRSASTVFMKSISANGDVKAYLEPYATAEHFGPEGRLKPQEELPAEPLYTVEAVKGWLEAKSTEKCIFVKELAYAVHGRYHVIPEGYKHTFLIRKPSKVFTSYYRLFSRMDGDTAQNFSDWLPGDTNVFKALSELAEYVETHLKQELIIIDTDDVMINPADMLQKYCQKIGLPYSERMLHWEKGLPDSWCIPESVRTAEDNFQWMTNVINSTGWGEGIKKAPDQKEALPEVVTSMVAAALPYYEKLRSHPKCLNLN